jgi:hypothetical protein
MPIDIYDRKSSLKDKILECASQEPEFTYKTDPYYIAFCDAVQGEIQKQTTDDWIIKPVWRKRLYSAWYISKRLRTHWHRPTKQSENAILWILFHTGWELDQGVLAVIAWWRLHHRPLASFDFHGLMKRAEQVFREIEPTIRRKKQAVKDQNMKNKKITLKDRILAALETQPSTTAYLAQTLKATPKAVDGHLYRMRGKQVTKLSWGVYGLIGKTYSGTYTVTAERVVPAREIIIPELSIPNLPPEEDIELEDGIAEYRQLPMIFDRENRSVSEVDEPVFHTREMPTAEPRWRHETDAAI